jgi:Domain of unknown function (DU1801)
MSKRKPMQRISSILQLYEAIPESERIIVDVLRQMILDELPAYCREKLSFNVPFFFGHKGICIIWPASIPRGGIKKGVLLGFWYGYLLNNEAGYLTRGTNKRVYYRILNHTTEIEPLPILQLLKEAIALDHGWHPANKTG